MPTSAVEHLHLVLGVELGRQNCLLELHVEGELED